jgi:biopolymer transport protein ExbD
MPDEPIIPTKPPPIEVEVMKGGKLLVDGKPVSLDELEDALTAATKRREIETPND